MPTMVSIFMAFKCGILNIRKLLIHFLILQKIELEKDFLILNLILENIFVDIWIYLNIKKYFVILEKKLQYKKLIFLMLENDFPIL